MLTCFHSMPWYSKEQPTPFDARPINGMNFLSGDVLAAKHRQEWIKDSKYPIITFPSGLQRELWDSSDEGGLVNIFGPLELPRTGDRDEGFEQAALFAKDYDYGVARRGDREVLVFHPYSGSGYAMTYDNDTRQLVDIKRFPDYAMDLLDIESRAILPELYTNEKQGLNAVAPVKFFIPGGSWTWYASEYNGEDIFFGLVAGFEVELGYFSLTELEGGRGLYGLPVERDLDYKPTTLRQLQATHRGM